MENEFKNYGMLIPQQAYDHTEKPDPNGVPIYRGCRSGGPCACIGYCKQIIGYETDPEKVAEYHRQVAERNQLHRDRLASMTIRRDGNKFYWETKPTSNGE